jgi:electron transport complex protein RnfB
MHTVIEQDCTGCELCLPVCPVDCMHLEVVSGSLTGWQAWSPQQAQQAQQRYAARQKRWEAKKSAPSQIPRNQSAFRRH